MNNSNALAKTGGQIFSLAPQSFQEALRFADLMASSGMVPKDYAGEPGRVLAAIQYGAEIGLPPMQSLQRIFIQHGKPTMDTRGCLSIVEASGHLEAKDEVWDEQTMTATVTLKRRGRKPIVRTFSKADADRVKVKEGDKVIPMSEKGTYKAYPQRMYTRRALGFALIDEFSDILGGLTPWDNVAEVTDHAGSDEPVNDFGDAAGNAKPVTPATIEGVADEELRGRLEKAFEALHLNPGQRRAKLLAFKGKETELLDWCRKEFAARTGKGGPAAQEPAALPAPATVAQEPPAVIDVQPEPAVSVAVVETTQPGDKCRTYAPAPAQEKPVDTAAHHQPREAPRTTSRRPQRPHPLDEKPAAEPPKPAATKPAGNGAQAELMLGLFAENGPSAEELADALLADALPSAEEIFGPDNGGGQ